MNPQFWKDKKIMVTGHTGFKGSWLSLWLKELGANVIGYSLAPPTNPSLFEIANVAEGMCSVTGDVRDLDHLKLFLADYPEAKGWLFYLGDTKYAFGNITVCPLAGILPEFSKHLS